MAGAPSVDAVHQFLPSFRRRDAIGMHTVAVQKLVRSMGLQSEIYAWDAPAADARGLGVRDYRSFARRAGASRAALLYQLSTGGPVGRYVLDRPEETLVNYHNITPARLLAPWHKAVGKELDEGRAHLLALASRARAGIAVSAFNEDELRSAGYRRTAVAPVLVDFDALDSEVDASGLDRLAGGKPPGGMDWLFVGRVAPNKCHHDLIKAVAAYRRAFGVPARLHLVGAPAAGSYLRALHQLVEALGLKDVVNLTGSVPPGLLAAHYRSADVFVCLSEHEGFCVPLVEAMRHRVPVVAFAAAAVPETVAGAGLLLRSKTPLTVAEAVERVRSGPQLRDFLIGRGACRGSDFDVARSSARFAAVLGDTLGAA
jgi:glycosyltransferase involved in cell wall biosynthesis